MQTVHRAVTIRERVAGDGLAIVQSVFSEEELTVLTQKLGHSAITRSRAGLRHAMRISAVAQLARGAALVEIAREI